MKLKMGARISMRGGNVQEILALLNYRLSDTLSPVTPLHALLLGLLQGITEFLPISSDGHLVVVETLGGLGIPSQLLGFDVLLHLGSLLALLACYPDAWWRLARAPFTRDGAHTRLLLLLMLATLPAVVIGPFAERWIAEQTRTVTFAAVGFIATGVLLFLAELFPQRRGLSGVGAWDALFIGVAQACALLPGVSRSGMTAGLGRLLGLTRSTAVDFSFLMAVPVIAGAVLFMSGNVLTGAAALPPSPVTVVGVLSSFGASVLAILFLRRLVQKHSLAWFALYLLPLAFFLLAR
jgi:undecaprenyl-diphosphatase